MRCVLPQAPAAQPYQGSIPARRAFHRQTLVVVTGRPDPDCQPDYTGEQWDPDGDPLVVGLRHEVYAGTG